MLPGSATFSEDERATSELSARRHTVRARCARLAARVPPGRMNSLSRGSPAFNASSKASSFSTWPAVMVARPGIETSPPRSNRSCWTPSRLSRIISGIGSASSTPIAEFSSSISPSAATRGLSLRTREPSPRPVSPPSPVRVVILERRWPMGVSWRRATTYAKGGTMIRKVVYFSMQVPNRPGVGVEMLRSIAKGKQNLLAFTGFPNGGKAQVDFVPAKPVEFARGAKKKGVKLGKKKTAFLVQGEDHVGALVRILEKLAKAKINMVAMDAVTGGSRRFGAIFWVKPKDIARTSRLLGAR